MCGPTTLSSRRKSHKNKEKTSLLTTTSTTLTADLDNDGDNEDTCSNRDSDSCSNRQSRTHQQQQHNHECGFLYGTLSLGLLVMANAVQMGHFQSRRDALGCDTLCIGSMTSTRSALSLIGSSIIGRWSDYSRRRGRDDQPGGTNSSRRGTNARKVCLMVGIIASMIDLFISSRATASITSLWLGMIPSALLQQNYNILKALFGEYHDEDASSADRAGSVGKLGMAVGLAFMAGPLMSSVFLTTYDHTVLFAALCLLLAFGFVTKLPPPPPPRAAATYSSSSSPPASSSSTKEDILLVVEKTGAGNGNKKSLLDSPSVPVVPQYLQLLVPAAVRTGPAIIIMCCRICMALAFHVFQTIWQTVLKERFEFGPDDYNRYFGFIGFTFALSQGYIAKIVLEKFGTSPSQRCRILLLGCTILGGGRLLVFQVRDRNNIHIVYAIFGAIILALGVVNTIFTADTSKIAKPEDLGGLFGVMGSVESLAGIVGPILGGFLSKIRPVQGPLYTVVSLYGIIFFIVYRWYEQTISRGGHLSTTARHSLVDTEEIVLSSQQEKKKKSVEKKIQ